MNIESYTDIPDRELIELLQVLDSAWPQNKSQAELVRLFLSKHCRRENFQSSIIKIDGKVVSHAEFFTRKIKINNVEVRVGGIAAVATLPKYKCRGYASTLVKEIFENTSLQSCEMILFQTPVPHFYEKLGARITEAQFITTDSNDKFPWWDPYVMIYPTSAPLKNSDLVNLCGEGW